MAFRIRTIQNKAGTNTDPARTDKPGRLVLRRVLPGKRGSAGLGTGPHHLIGAEITREIPGDHYLRSALGISGKKSIDTDGKAHEGSDPYIEHFTRTNGFLPEDHPIHVKVSSILKRLGEEDIPLHILISEEINAFCTDHGNIFVTTGLLNKVEFEEELLGAIAHELIHKNDEHADKAKKMGHIRNFPISAIGLQRMHEVSADTKAWLLLAGKKINPKGLSMILSKIYSESDVVHGSTRERNAVQNMLKHYEDTDSVDLPMTPVELKVSSDPRDTFGKDISKLTFMQKMAVGHFEAGKYFATSRLQDKEEEHIRSLERLSLLIDDILKDIKCDKGTREMNKLMLLYQEFGIAERYSINRLKGLERSKNLEDIVSAMRSNDPSQIARSAMSLLPLFPDIGKKLHYFIVDHSGAKIDKGDFGDPKDIDNIYKYIDFASAVFNEYLKLCKPSEPDILKADFIERMTESFWGVLKGNKVADPNMYYRILQTLVERTSGYNAFEVAAANGEEPLLGLSLEIDELPLGEDGRERLEYLIHSRMADIRSTLIQSAINPLHKSLLELDTDINCAEDDSQYFDPIKGPNSIKQLLELKEHYIKQGKLDDLKGMLFGTFRALHSVAISSGDPLRREVISFILFACDTKQEFIDRFSYYLREVKDETDTKHERNERYGREDDIFTGPEQYTDTISLMETVISECAARDKAFKGPKLEIGRNDLQRILPLVSDLREGLLRHLKGLPVQKVLPALIDVAAKYPIYVTGIPQFSNGSLEIKEKLLRRVTKGLSASALNDKRTLEGLFLLSTFFSDQIQGAHLRDFCLERILKNPSVTFKDAMDLIFVKYGHQPARLFDGALIYLSEEKARTASDFESLEERLGNKLDDIEGNHAEAGALAIINDAVSNRLSLDTASLLLALMSTEAGTLESYLYDEVWLPMIKTNFETNLKGVSICTGPDKGSVRSQWLVDIPERGLRDDGIEGPGVYEPFTSTVEHIRLLDVKSKQLLLRRALLGKGGVFTNNAKAMDVLIKLCGMLVDYDPASADGKRLAAIIESICDATSPEEKYELFAPFLLDHLIPPQPEKLCYFRLAVKKGEKEMQKLVRKKAIGQGTPEIKALLSRKMLHLILGRYVTNGFIESNCPSDLKKYLMVDHWIVGDSWEKEDPLAGDAEIALIKNIFVEEESKAATIGKMPLSELAVKVAENGGAVLTRFLQLYAQSQEMSPEVMSRLLDVFDNVRGQLRAVAYRTLKKAYGGSPAKVSELFREIMPREGGGSMATVYAAVTGNGEKEALRVLSPNVRSDVTNKVGILSRATEELKKKLPADDPLLLSADLLGVTERWILEDIDDRDYEAVDRTFFEQNDGYSGPNGYVIRVPRSKGTPSVKVRRDEFIEGQNLTSMIKRLDDPRIKIVFKSVVALLARNFIFKQLPGRLIHADIHPGNIRVNNKEVTLLDRTGAKTLTEEELKIVGKLISALSNRGKIDDVFCQMLATYLLKDTNNLKANISLAELSSILHNEFNMSDLKTQPFDKISKLLGKMAMYNISAPLNLYILLKDLRALDKLAKLAGYNDMLGAINDSGVTMTEKISLFKALGLSIKDVLWL